MSFPTTFPDKAVETLGGLLLNKPATKETIALAVYDLLGFGLYTWLGDVKYPMLTGQSILVDAVKVEGIKDWFKALSDDVKLQVLMLVIQQILKGLKKE